jgi:hypothetical protein
MRPLAIPVYDKITRVLLCLLHSEHGNQFKPVTGTKLTQLPLCLLEAEWVEVHIQSINKICI